MIFAFEAFGVNLVNVFRAGGAGRKPAILRHYFQSADRGAVARGLGQLRGNPLTRELRSADQIGGEIRKLLFFLGSRRRVDAGVRRFAEAADESLVVLTRILSGPGRDLGSE